MCVYVCTLVCGFVGGAAEKNLAAELSSLAGSSTRARGPWELHGGCGWGGCQPWRSALGILSCSDRAHCQRIPLVSDLDLWFQRRSHFQGNQTPSLSLLHGYAPALGLVARAKRRTKLERSQLHGGGWGLRRTLERGGCRRAGGKHSFSQTFFPIRLATGSVDTAPSFQMETAEAEKGPACQRLPSR